MEIQAANQHLALEGAADELFLEVRSADAQMLLQIRISAPSELWIGVVAVVAVDHDAIGIK